MSVRIGEGVSHPTLGDEIKVSLGTKDPKEAKRIAAEVLPQFNLIWDSFATAPGKLTHKQIVALSGEAYRAFTEALSDDPGDPELWQNVREANEAAVTGSILYIGNETQRYQQAMRRRFGGFVDATLRKHHLRVDPDTHSKLLEQFGRAMDEASELLHRRSLGDYRPDTNAERFPDMEKPKQRRSAKDTTLMGLFDLWAEEHTRLGKAPRTVARWRPMITGFIVFLGHDDAARITTGNIMDWRVSLIDSGKVTAGTFSRNHRAALGAVFSHALASRRIDANPLAGLHLGSERKIETRSLAFKHAEAHSILAASLDPEMMPARASTEIRRALRWVPWLAVYTGARPGELCQLRGQDFVVEDGIKCIRITPEAGTVKGSKIVKARIVPLHSHLLEQGIWEFARGCGSGPLFYRLGRRSKMPWELPRDRLAEWVRYKVGVSDTAIRPSHAWRHYFKALGRAAAIDDAYLDAICGHAPASQGRRYGHFPVEALAREIAKLPKVDVRSL